MARGDYLRAQTAPAHLGDALAHVVVLLGALNGGQRAGLPKLYVEPQIQLHLHEQLQAAHREIRVEVGDVAPTRRAYLPGVDAGRLARDFAALDERRAPPAPREIERRRRPRDTAAYHQYVGFGHFAAPRALVMDTVPARACP